MQIQCHNSFESEVPRPPWGADRTAELIHTMNDNSSTSCSSAPSDNVYIVTVGKSNFAYEPNSLVANPGDVIVFQFYPTNHSVVQGRYCGDSEGGCNPCVPISLTSATVQGFH